MVVLVHQGGSASPLSNVYTRKGLLRDHYFNSFYSPLSMTATKKLLLRYHSQLGSPVESTLLALPQVAQHILMAYTSPRTVSRDHKNKAPGAFAEASVVFYYFILVSSFENRNLVSHPSAVDH